MDLQIRGKTAIMAGSSAGMGRATAERLAEAGANLVIWLGDADKEFTGEIIVGEDGMLISMPSGTDKIIKASAL